MRFTIRDLLWLTAIAGLAVAWWVDRSHAFCTNYKWEIRAKHAAQLLRREGWGVTWHPDHTEFLKGKDAWVAATQWDTVDLPSDPPANSNLDTTPP